MASGSRPRGSRPKKGTRNSRRREQPGATSKTNEAAELGKLAGQIAAGALGAAAEIDSAADVEVLASSLAALWDRPDWEVPLELSEALGIAVVDRIARAADRDALVLLRGLAAVGDHPVGELATSSAAALRPAIDAPEWIDAVGAATVGETKLLRDPVFDDGISIAVEITWPNGERRALLALIDHNLGTIAKDLFVGPSIEGVEELTRQSGEAVSFEPIAAADAATRIVAAMERTDETFQAPVSESYRELDAFATAQLGDLSLDGEEPEFAELPVAERKELVDAFLASPHAAAHLSDPFARDIADLALDFGADYVDAGPLRWSPVVVELFLADWLPRKVVMERAFFERVPFVLADWIRFAGEQRGIPAAAIEQTVECIDGWREEMLQAVDDPAAWGPAKTFAQEAERDGIDLTDPDALEQYIEQRNRAA